MKSWWRIGEGGAFFYVLKRFNSVERKLDLIDVGNINIALFRCGSEGRSSTTIE